MDEDEENIVDEEMEDQDESQENSRERQLKNTNISKTNRNRKMVKKSQISADKAKKLGEVTKNFGKMSQIGALGPLLVGIITVILILIVVIGIIGFFVSMPGLITGKLKDLGNSIASWFKDMYTPGAVAKVSDEDIIELADYITDMGYDLIGYGFVVPSSKVSGIITVEQLIEDGYELVEVKIPENKKKNKKYEKYDQRFLYSKDKNDISQYYRGQFYNSNGIVYNGLVSSSVSSFDDLENLDDRSGLPYTDGKDYYEKYGIKYKDDGKIWSKSDFWNGDQDGLDNVDISLLKTYAVSNKSIYILRNDDDGFFEKILSNIVSFFTGTNYDSWANGLVRIYNSEKSIAKSEYWDSIFNTDSWFDAVEFTDNGKLRLKNGAFNNPVDFETDGWTGRYGLSQDFLMSLHLATLSPELVKTIVQSYDTEVQVYIDKVESSKVFVKMIDTSSSKIGTDDTALTLGVDGMEYVDSEGKKHNVAKETDLNFTDSWINPDTWWVSEEEAARFFYALDMDSPKDCTYSYKGGLPNHVRDALITDGADHSGVDENGNAYEGAINELSFSLDEFSLEKDLGDDYVNPEKLPKNKVDSSYDYTTGDMLSVNIIKSVENLIDLMDKEKYFGFSKEEFLKRVTLHDESSCRTANFFVEDSPFDIYNDYSAGDNEKCPGDWFNCAGGIHTPVDYSRINMKFFEENGITMKSKDDGVSYSYNDGINVLSNDELMINNDLRLNSIHPGTECFFENHAFETADSGFITGIHDSMVEYYSECSCSFCKTFYQKYLYVVKANKRDADEHQERLRCEYAELPENKDDPYNNSYEYVNDIYSWAYTDNNGEKIEYHISFYKPNTGGNVKLCVTRAWTAQELAIEMEKKSSDNTCSKEIKKCTSLDDAEDKFVCSQCKSYVNDIIDSLMAINDDDFSAYVPYIARVVNSWFRDTFFIIPTEKNAKVSFDSDGNIVGDVAVEAAIKEYGYDAKDLTGTNMSIISNDEEYLKETNELWTEYIVTDKGDYALFILDTTGKLLTSESDIDRYLDKKERTASLTQEDRDLLYKGTTGNTYIKPYYKDDNGNMAYGYWDASDEDKKANALLEKYDISLVKVPVKKDFGKLSNGEYDNKEVAWSAYSRDVKKGTIEWQEMDFSSPDTPGYMKDVVSKYVGVDDNGNSGQIIYKARFARCFYSKTS